MLVTESLHYPAGDHTPEYVLSTLGSEPTAITEQTARHTLNLLTAAYEAHFEDPEMYIVPLDPGTVREHFDPENDDQVERQLASMVKYVAAGSRYLYLNQVGGQPNLTDGGAIAGLVKVSPSLSRLQRLRRKEPNVFINDIIVHPELQQRTDRLGRAAGATLLHAALGHTGFAPDRAVALHAFEGDSVTDWYRRLGMQPIRQVEAMTIGGEELPQVLWTTAKGVTAGTVRRALERRHPQLAYARLTPRDALIEPYET